uniref:class I SAM-dependent methyltransferase n=1 Tax=Thaumasiovibrio occultus TaxID=1891184 RepID=UPI000B354822|nr:class I SAM-dependent methyltransferase [Thaumasiovibrio occultus]
MMAKSSSADNATARYANKNMIEPQFVVPEHLIMPLWLRSVESLSDEGLVYDPMAASVCSQCVFSTAVCDDFEFSTRQLLHNAITHLTDNAVSDFLSRYPSGWVINLSDGLDTRFYRLDNGRCRWLELDTSESLIWRQRLLHKNERFYPRAVNLTDSAWIKDISIPA